MTLSTSVVVFYYMRIYHWIIYTTAINTHLLKKFTYFCLLCM